MLAAFVHIPKTGGTSVRAVLDGAIINFGHRPVRDYAYQCAGIGHTAGEWDSAFKFTFVRNPWDRIRSRYLHDIAGSVGSETGTTRQEFRRWVSAQRAVTLFNQSCGEMLRGTQFDFVGRFESFEHDLRRVAAWLEVDVPLVHSNSCRVAGVSSDWRDYYDTATHDIVAELGAWEIDQFGYTFDDCAIQHAA